MSTERTGSVMPDENDLPPRKSLLIDPTTTDATVEILQALKLETPKVHESRYPKWTGSRLQQLPPAPTFASVKDPVFERVDSNILRRLTVLEGLVARILTADAKDSGDPAPPPYPPGDGIPLYRRKRGKRGGKRKQVPTHETDDGTCVD
jgi:hypothetical protein